jgi:hypothetical protein
MISKKYQETSENQSIGSFGTEQDPWDKMKAGRVANSCHWVLKNYSAKIYDGFVARVAPHQPGPWGSIGTRSPLHEMACIIGFTL